MSDGGLCALTLAEQARLIRERQVSPKEVVASSLAQIEKVNPRLNAFLTVMGDQARAGAEKAEREITSGSYRGPLHGIPIGLKDLLCTKGVRTTGGSRILADFVPEEDATVVSRLQEAGAVLMGKLNMHEFAFGPTGTNPHYGDARNPWDPERITGGSSSGSAIAAATFMCAGTLGSDTGGSIRIPAALCGVVGIKPTYGRVSRYGAIPCAWSLDNVGPMCRTAEDAALVLSTIAGHDPKDPATIRRPVPDYAAGLGERVSGLKVAVLREYVTDPMEPDVVARFQESLAVLRGLGMVVEEISVPEANTAMGASSAILSSEVAAYHEERLRTRPGDFGADVRARLEQGLMISATDYLKGQRIRRLVVERFQELMGRYDAMVCPTEPCTAPRLDQETVDYGGFSEARVASMVRHTRLFNLNSLPAVSVPCGFGSNGLPVGLQIATGPFEEGLALRIAHAYQQATEWHKRVPPTAL